MNTRRALLQSAALLMLCAAPLHARAQEATPTPAPSAQPTPPAVESQEPVKVFTEEVLIPVSAYDPAGWPHPTLGLEDIAVFEDDVPQQIRSVRRVASSVLLLLDTAGGMDAAVSVETTREAATRLVSNLRAGDRVAALQFGGRVELLQDWTTDADEVKRALKTKLFSGRRARLSEALAAAAMHLKRVPAGSRHVVLVTDGVEASGDKAALTESVRRMLDSQATVHVVGYAGLGRRAAARRHPAVKITTDKRKSAIDIANEIMNPTQQTDAQRRNRVHVIIDTDTAMRRARGAYERAAREGEQWLGSLAEETGGEMSLPASAEELIAQGDEIARAIGAHYVVTYAPQRPLASAAEGEYRGVRVTSRRVGLQLRTRRGYVATPR